MMNSASERNTPGRGGGDSGNTTRRLSSQQMTLLLILLVNVGMFLATALLYDYNHHDAAHHDEFHDNMAHAPPGSIRGRDLEDCPTTSQVKLLKEEKKDALKQLVDIQKESTTTLGELKKKVSTKDERIQDLIKKVKAAEEAAAEAASAAKKTDSKNDGEENKKEDEKEKEELKKKLATKDERIQDLIKKVKAAEDAAAEAASAAKKSDNKDDGKEKKKEDVAEKKEAEEAKKAAALALEELEKLKQESSATIQELERKMGKKDTRISDLLQKVNAKPNANGKANKDNNDNNAVTRELTISADGALALTKPDDRFTILPHELPGYTGFARPPYTLAPFFSISDTSSSVAKVGEPFSVNVHCSHNHCKNGGALFYLRAYGPAILPGKTTDHKNGTYTLTVYPHDAGQYHYEAVLTFSKAPKMEELPVPGTPGEPSYEGYMIPGFPVTFQVGSSKEQQDLQQMQRRQQEERIANPQDLPACTARDLLETGMDTPLEKARWVLANKPRHNATWETIKGTDYKTKDDISLEGYQDSINSVGIQMDYRYTNCHLEPMENLVNADLWRKAMKESKRSFGSKKKRLHFVFFGDSNIRNQYNFFRDRVAKPLNYLDGEMALSYVEVMKFWPYTWEKSKDTFLNLTRDHDDHFVTVYNVGLHEIANRCALFGQRAGRVKSNPGPCIPFYREDVSNMTEVIKSKPGMVKIWQSTTAGWPKWGVFGVAWPQKGGQPFPQATDSCATMNQVAWDVVKEQGMSVMDAYWMTLSRPDHREVIDKDASRTSYKLVHMGPEVYVLLLRQIMTIALDAIRNGKAGVQFL